MGVVSLATVEPGYNDIGLWDTSSIASEILWYQLIKLLRGFFLNQLVTHSQPHHYTRSEQHSFVTTQNCPFHDCYYRVRLYLQLCPSLIVAHDCTTMVKFQFEGSEASGISLALWPWKWTFK
jgi:hypothetical protein